MCSSGAAAWRAVLSLWTPILPTPILPTPIFAAVPSLAPCPALARFAPHCRTCTILLPAPHNGIRGMLSVQDVWRDFVAEFVLHVVRRPVVVAGNSIGGFIAASVCADFPGMCQGWWGVRD